MYKIAVNGAGGRMGQAVLQDIAAADDCSLAAAVVRADSPRAGQIALGGIAYSTDLAPAVKAADVLVDFSAPEAALRAAAVCAEQGRPLVCGTTGMQAGELRELEALAQRIPLVYAPNMSVGVTLALRLLETAATVLGEDFDVEIQETHHRHKRDAPSGTALRMGEVVAAARGRQLADCAVYERVGQTGPRPAGGIGFAVTRAGDVVGEHSVLFAGSGERLQITHKASSRQTFANGALRAARWTVGRKPGFYSMRDVLGI